MFDVIVINFVVSNKVKVRSKLLVIKLIVEVVVVPNLNRA